MPTTNALLKRIALGLLGLSLMAYGLWPRNEESTATRTRTRNAASVGSGAKASTPLLVKIPIKDMRVGTRVPAFNPEVSATERSGFREPNWYQWMKLRMEMPKPDGTMLEIEMLRSEEWLVQHTAVVVQPESVMLPAYSETERTDANAFALSEPSSLGSPAIATAKDSTATKTPAPETTGTEARSSEYSGIPLRPIYFHLAELLSEAAADGDEVLGLVVQLDLPELGLSGPAWIVDLEPAPIIPPGPGQVVTATFKHASANVLDLVLTSNPPSSQTTSLSTQPSSYSAINTSPSPPIASPSELSDPPTDSIGVTANHPFWSVDRAEFVQAGELQIGERLQTLAGDIHWVQQKLPRPGPEPVYNLEVHDEHVYYVGVSGVLAHNVCNLKRNNTELRNALGIAGDTRFTPHHLTPVEAVTSTGLKGFFKKAASAGWGLNRYRNGYAISAGRHKVHRNYNAYVINRIRNYVKRSGGINKISAQEARAYLDRLNYNLKEILSSSNLHINQMPW